MTIGVVEWSDGVSREFATVKAKSLFVQTVAGEQGEGTDDR